METIEAILAAGGGIVLLGNASAVIYKIFHPAVKVKQDVEAVKQDVEELKTHDQKDYEAIQHLNRMNRAQCNLLLSMMNHMIDGNGIEKMKTTRDEIQNMLSE